MSTTYAGIGAQCLRRIHIIVGDAEELKRYVVTSISPALPPGPHPGRGPLFDLASQAADNIEKEYIRNGGRNNR